MVVLALVLAVVMAGGGERRRRRRINGRDGGHWMGWNWLVEDGKVVWVWVVVGSWVWMKGKKVEGAWAWDGKVVWVWVRV